MQNFIEAFDEEIDEEIEFLEVLDYLEHGVPRQINHRSNYFETMDASTKNINNSVSPVNQLITCLRVFSTGGHLDSIGDFAGMHFSTLSRIVVRVSEAIARLSPQCIQFPNTENQIRKTQQDFFEIAGFPRVIGTIDCSHFRISSPGGEDPEIYRNRKGYFSINGQFICNANLKIMMQGYKVCSYGSTNSIACREASMLTNEIQGRVI